MQRIPISWIYLSAIFLMLLIRLDVKGQSPPLLSIQNYVDQYFADLNNIGSSEYSVEEKEFFLSKILNTYFEADRTLLMNHFYENRSAELKANEYLSSIIYEYEKGITFSYDSLFMDVLVPDGRKFKVKLYLVVKINPEGVNPIISREVWVLDAFTVTENRFVGKILSTSKWIEVPARTILTEDVEQAKWVIASDENTKESYQEYLDQYPDGKYNVLARDKLIEIENNAWLPCVKTKGRSACEFYVKEYPDGRYVLQASSILDSLENSLWTIARSSNSARDYKYYLEEYPEGRYAENARSLVIQVEDDLWQSVRKINTKKEYEQYLEDYPDGKYADEARANLFAIEESYWNKIKEREAIEGYRKYLLVYPGGVFAEEANSKINEYEYELWDEAKKKKTKELLDRYLVIFPNGKYGQDARDLIDKIEEDLWETAVRDGRIESYEKYLDEYPEGRFSQLARSEIDDIRANKFAPEKALVSELKGNMEFVKGGSMTLGCTPEYSSNCSEKDFPTQWVQVDDFNISKYEVTQSQWKAIMGYNPSYFVGCDECPVEYVGIDEVNEFLRKLNEFTDSQFRLPTENEWEYAMKGGAKERGGQASASSLFSSFADQSWYKDNSEGKTHRVGQKKPNSLGLYDGLGNVSEWCMTNDPSLGIKEVDEAIVKGGSWDHEWRDCLPMVYHKRLSRKPTALVGFRLVMDVN